MDQRLVAKDGDTPKTIEGSTIGEVAERLSSTHELNDIIAVVRGAAHRLSGADGVTFVVRDGDSYHYADSYACHSRAHHECGEIQGSCFTFWTLVGSCRSPIQESALG
jgi:hypothetical protein